MPARPRPEAVDGLADLDAGLLGDARALVAALEAGDGAAAGAALDRLLKAREAELYQDIGRLTRDLHDALNNFSPDAKLVRLAERDLPDTRARLAHVIEMTEQAAHRTLAAVEQGLPLSRRLAEQAGALGDGWRRFLGREMEAEEFRGLARRLEAFLAEAGALAGQLQDCLSEVLVAQDYQDLTGQIIRQAIELGHEMEQRLVGILRMLGRGRQSAPADGEKLLAGPQVPGRESPDAVRGQDEVDELLSSLGF